jgi:hypothetical protein
MKPAANCGIDFEAEKHIDESIREIRPYRGPSILEPALERGAHPDFDTAKRLRVSRRYVNSAATDSANIPMIA